MAVGRREGGPSGRAGRPEKPGARTRTGGVQSRQRRAPAAGSAARSRGGVPNRRPRELHAAGPGPGTAPIPRPVERPARPKTTSQAKARAKARKAKAPKVVRTPLRDRILAKLATVDLRPRTLLARVPFVVLIITTLGVGLAITLWLSTEAAQRSYQIGSARAVNEALAQQKEALERDVLEAESAPALAEAARELGMIPSRDTAHLVQDPGGNWIVIGDPKPAEGAPPPPLNTELPDVKPAPPAPTPKPGAEVEVLRRVTPPTAGQSPVGAPEAPVRLPAVIGTPHAAPGALAGPQPGPASGPAPGPVPEPPGGLAPGLPVLPPALTLPPALALPPALTLPPAVPAPPGATR